MDYKISVIIPVYKVEPYLRRCVSSVLEQTYRNLEIILVNDGSPDDCPRICDEFAIQDKRVSVIHKDNGGLSSARNAALNRGIEGDYVTFVDSDDWIESDTYEYCIKLLQKYNADCVQFEINMTDSPDKIVLNPPESIKVFSNKDTLQYFMLRATRKSGGFSVCGGLYHRDLLEGLKFREGKVNEDIDYKFKVMQRCKKLVVTNQKKYNYGLQ